MRLPRPVNRESFLAGLQRLRLPLIFWACDRTISYQYTLSYIRSLPPTSETGKIAAVDAIATALRLPNIFDFDPLFKLDAVVAVNDHELFSLLHIFLNDVKESSQKLEEHLPGPASELHNVLGVS